MTHNYPCVLRFETPNTEQIYIYIFVFFPKKESALFQPIFIMFKSGGRKKKTHTHDFFKSLKHM